MIKPHVFSCDFTADKNDNWAYTGEKQNAFFWVTFQFQNERNTILVIPPPKVEWTESFWKRFIRKNGISQKSNLFAKYMSPQYSFDSP